MAFDGNTLRGMIERLRGDFFARADPQRANTALMGPASGVPAAATFRALTVADVPQVWDLSRTLGAATGSYVEIGSFDVANGSHNLRVSVTVTAAGHTISKQFAVVTKYAQTSGAWHYAIPLADSGFYNYDFQIVVNQSGTSVALRLYQLSGSANADAHNIRIENVGLTTDAFTTASATGTMTAPTVALASSMDVRARSLYLTRTIPTTVGNYVGIGSFAGVPLGHAVQVTMSNSDGGFAVSKTYVVASTYAEQGTNAIVLPISSTGPYSSQDYDLVGVQSGAGLTLYLLRTAGTTAGTATVAIRYDGAPTMVFTESTATGSMAVPTVFYPSALLTQVDGNVGIGIKTPTSKHHVAGAEAIGSVAKSANFAANNTAGTYRVTTAASTITATLPAANTCADRKYVFLKVDAGAGTVVVTRAGSDTINGATTYTLTGQYARVTIQSDGGTAWYVLSQ